MSSYHDPSADSSQNTALLVICPTDYPTTKDSVDAANLLACLKTWQDCPDYPMKRGTEEAVQTFLTRNIGFLDTFRGVIRQFTQSKADTILGFRPGLTSKLLKRNKALRDEYVECHPSQPDVTEPLKTLSTLEGSLTEHLKKGTVTDEVVYAALDAKSTYEKKKAREKFSSFLQVMDPRYRVTIYGNARFFDWNFASGRKLWSLTNTTIRDADQAGSIYTYDADSRPVQSDIHTMATGARETDP